MDNIHLYKIAEALGRGHIWPLDIATAMEDNWESKTQMLERDFMLMILSFQKPKGGDTDG